MQIDKALEIFGYTDAKKVDKKCLKSDYRKLGKLYHPDNIKTGDALKFKDIKEAYLLLEIWVSDNTLGSKSKGALKFKFSELLRTKESKYIRDTNGNRHERIKAINSDAFIVFEPTVKINNTIFEDITLTKYNMIGTYELYLEVDIDSDIDIESICVQLYEQERVLEVKRKASIFEFKFGLQSATAVLRLRINRIPKEIKPEYIICSSAI